MTRFTKFLTMLALLTVATGAWADDEIPSNATGMMGSFGVYSITKGGNYRCSITGKLEYQIQIKGGTSENPVRIYLSGDTECPTGDAWQRPANAPLLYIYSGYVELIGVNNARLLNTVHSIIYVGSAATDDIHLSVRNITFDADNGGTNNPIFFGLSNYDISTTFEGCTFQNMNCASYAGFFQARKGTHTLTDCTFKNNRGATAGALRVNDNGATVTCADCTFDGNEACYTVDGSVGAGAIKVDAGELTLDNCVVKNSRIDSEAVSTIKGAVYVASEGTLTLKGTTTIAAQDDSADGNIYLASGAKVTLNDDWTGSAGVTVADPPSIETTRIVTTDGAATSGNLFADNSTQRIGYADQHYYLYRTTSISLSDADSNTKAVRDAVEYGAKYDVTLQGRTLYKDGGWNTLCLPFDVNIAGSVLDGATAKTLESTDYDNDTKTLTLTFGEAVSKLEAGKPYIIKWESGDDLVNPVFEGVTINNVAANVSTEYAEFKGDFSPITIDNEDKTMLYLGADNKLYYPNAAMTIGSCRAYFQLADGITAGDLSAGVRSFVLNFGEDELTNIKSQSLKVAESQSWYDLSGRRLSGKPTESGIYINNGRKVVIK